MSVSEWNAARNSARPAASRNQPEHHMSATRFHRVSSVSSCSSRASARSFARTCSSVSPGPSARPMRMATAAPMAVSRGSRSKSGKGDRTFPCTPTRWRLSEHVPRRGADQAVANAQSMVEEGQGPTGSERREPERQAAQLNGHRVDVYAVQASLCDRSPESCPVRLRDVRARRGTLANQRRFVRRGEVAAGGHEERAAAHRGIDDPQGHDPLGYGVLNERGERAADEVFGQRTRRVERSGGLAPVLSCRSRRRVLGQLEVEQPLVHAAELLDAEVAVGDALATCRFWACRARRQCEHRLPHGAVVQGPGRRRVARAPARRGDR